MNKVPTLLIATTNPDKLREISAAILNTAHCPALRLLCLNDLPAIPPEPDETGITFAENARLKALYYSRHAGMATLADDSGLSVDALDGAPGVYSSTFAGIAGPRSIADPANNRKLVESLRDVPEGRRGAQYHCALAMAAGGTVHLESHGQLQGRIIDTPLGDGGFGYDPHFYVPALGRTTAEITADEKNAISHRGAAVRDMAGRLRNLLDNAPQLFF